MLLPARQAITAWDALPVERCDQLFRASRRRRRGEPSRMREEAAQPGSIVASAKLRERERAVQLGEQDKTLVMREKRMGQSVRVNARTQRPVGRRFPADV